MRTFLKRWIIKQLFVFPELPKPPDGAIARIWFIWRDSPHCVVPVYEFSDKTLRTVPFNHAWEPTDDFYLVKRENLI